LPVCPSYGKPKETGTAKGLSKGNLKITDKKSGLKTKPVPQLGSKKGTDTTRNGGGKKAKGTRDKGG